MMHHKPGSDMMVAMLIVCSGYFISLHLCMALKQYMLSKLRMLS